VLSSMYCACWNVLLFIFFLHVQRHSFSLFSTRQVFNEADYCFYVLASPAMSGIAGKSGSVVQSVLRLVECTAWLGRGMTVRA